MTNRYEYEITGIVNDNYYPRWTGSYNGTSLGSNQSLHTELTIPLCNRIQSQKGGIWLTKGEETTVKGTLVVNGKR